MSLMKVRDMSILNTAPQNRLPIETFVMEFNEELAARAIREEIGRGGQVYYLHNRVETIEEIYLLPAAPGARGVRGRGPRPDGRGRAGGGDAPLRPRRAPAPALHDDHRERAGHPERQHDHHRQGGRAGRLAAVPAAGQGGQGRHPRLRVPVLPRQARALRDRHEAPAHHLRPHGAGLGVQDRPEGPGDPRARATSSAASSTGTSSRWATTCTCACWTPRSPSCRTRSAEEPPEVYMELEYSGYIPDAYIPDPMEKMEVYKKIASVTTERGVRQGLQGDRGQVRAHPRRGAQRARPCRDPHHLPQALHHLDQGGEGQPARRVLEAVEGLGGQDRAHGAGGRGQGGPGSPTSRTSSC